MMCASRSAASASVIVLAARVPVGMIQYSMTRANIVIPITEIYLQKRVMRQATKKRGKLTQHRRQYCCMAEDTIGKRAKAPLNIKETGSPKRSTYWPPWPDQNL